MTEAEVAQEFTKREFVQGKREEKMSETFVVNARYVHTHALCHVSVRQCLVAGAELGHGSPFESLSKIAQVIRKVKCDTSKVKWVFPMMLHLVQHKSMSAGELSISGLFGDGKRQQQTFNEDAPVTEVFSYVEQVTGTA